MYNNNYYYPEFKERSNILNMKKLIFFSLSISLISLILSSLNFYDNNVFLGLLNLTFSIFSIFISFSFRILSNRDIKALKNLNSLFIAYIFISYIWSCKEIFLGESIIFGLTLFSINTLATAVIFNQNHRIHAITLSVPALVLSIYISLEFKEDMYSLITFLSIILADFILSYFINKNTYGILYKNYENEILIQQKDKFIDEIQQDLDVELNNKADSIEKLYEETSKTNEKLKETMEELKKSYSELNKKSEEHYLLFRISMNFNSSNPIEYKINKALEILGVYTNVSRVYIFENNENEKTSSNTYEWTNENINPEKDKLQNIPKETIQEWFNMLEKDGEIRSSNIKELPKNIREVLEPQKIKSILVLPIYFEGSLYGFIGFDDCIDHQHWDNEKVELLNIISNLVTNELERKKYYEQLRKAKLKAEISNETKTKFLANMNHEIRTPLNTIITINSILRRDNNFSEESNRLLNLSYEASKNLQSLINKILDFSKIEQNEIIFNNETFDLDFLLEGIIEEYKMKQNEKIAINYKYDSDNKFFIGDKVKIYQIINNIINNAYNHTKEGHINLKVNTEIIDEENTKIFFNIEDTGSGIDKENIENIFQDFYQVYTEEKRKYSGIGLGLPIAKRLIEKMGGEVSVKSKIKEGTIFEFYIILKNGKYYMYENNYTHEDVNFEHEKVLLVEDNEVNLEIQKKLLELYNLKVDIAKDGKDGIDKILKNINKYKIIFMDISMPVMNGYEVIEYLNENISDRNFKIVALTAFSSSYDRKKVFDFGFDEFLSKPIEEKELLKILNKYIYKEKIDKKNFEGIIDKNRDILDLFVKDLQEKIPILETSYNKGDMQKMHDVFHQIKNPFKYLKYDDMYEKALNLENLSDKKNYETLNLVYPKFIEELNDFVENHRE